MSKRKVVQNLLVLCLVAMLGLTGCSLVQRGVAVGTGLGALTGGIIGHNGAEGVLEGAVMGGGAGGILGALVGDGMQQSKTAEEIANLQSQIDVLMAENGSLKDKNKQLEDEIAKLRARISELEKENEQLRNRKSAVEITLDGDVLFGSGSAKLTPEGMNLLAELAKNLKNKYPGRAINIQGHTDNEPITNSSWKSNWELGAARSLSVLHYLVDKQGRAGDSVSATTFGEYKPVAKNDTPENMQKNRRSVISITVEK